MEYDSQIIPTLLSKEINKLEVGSVGKYKVDMTSNTCKEYTKFSLLSDIFNILDKEVNDGTKPFICISSMKNIAMIAFYKFPRESIPLIRELKVNAFGIGSYIFMARYTSSTTSNFTSGDFR